MTSSSWLILADDLTGAADCAVAFAARGLPTTVGWAGRRPEAAGELCVFAYDGESRNLTAHAAALARAKVMASMGWPLASVFAKIDSTLRGQPAAEIRATLQAAPAGAVAIVAPAFPATGRTTEGGRVRVAGAPLEEAEVWRRDHSYPSADLVEVLATEGLKATALPLAVVRAEDGALREALASAAGPIICDAVTDQDLDRIVRAGLGLARPAVWIGAGGLTAALARAATASGRKGFEVPQSAKGLLVVAGSPAAATRAAAARLASEPGMLEVRIEASQLLASGWTLDPTVLRALDLGRDVMINLRPEDPIDLSKGLRLVHTLAQAIKPLAGHFGALAVTGGETAAAVLNAFGIDGVRLAEEMEPGVSVGLTLGEQSFPIVTKAGAFGDAGVLVRAAARLRQIKQEGRVA